MKMRKLFAGQSVRRLREARGLTQAELSKRMAISPSYLSQIELNHRPLSGALVVELSRILRVDVSELSDIDTDKLAATMREVFVDGRFQGDKISSRELREAALNTPNVSRSLVDMHLALRNAEDKLVRNNAESTANKLLKINPSDEVRDYFHYKKSYIDELDRVAEEFSKEFQVTRPHASARIENYLKHELGIEIVYVPEHESKNDSRPLQDPGPNTILHWELDDRKLKFFLSRELARYKYGKLVNSIIERAGFESHDAKKVCREALYNYWAAAFVMPYDHFFRRSQDLRYDLQRLSMEFETSLEQVAHRVTSLQRPKTEGIPFYFIRVDRAGNVTKRASATSFQIARVGGTCPIWNVHSAFENPGRIDVQVTEMPDNSRYLSLAFIVSKISQRMGLLDRRYAIGLGCELSYAEELVYSDMLDLKKPFPVLKIGTNCRLCDRSECAHRVASVYN